MTYQRRYTHVRRSFWREIATGASTDQAAAAAGMSPRHGYNEFHQAGGMSPLDLADPSPLRLSHTDRDQIAVLRAAGASCRAIAFELGRAPSTISRELNRNTHRSGVYLPGHAQRCAEARARRPKPTKLALDPRLCQEVQRRLSGPSHCSPEQISNRLPLDFPHDPRMRISDESIYKAIYVQGRGALRRELAACLRTGRAVRKPAARTDQRSTRATRADMVMISERPAQVEDRAVPGAWEGDLITGAHNASAVVTLVERSTRFVLLGHLPHAPRGSAFGAPQGDQPTAVDTTRPGHGAVAVREVIAEVITTLPQHLRTSLTWDQGVEMSQHVQLAAQADVEIYFCDPHSPWQRGTNENTNGLLRQYLPKSSDLSRYSAQDLAEIADGLNDRPRKTLGWRTPREVMTDLLCSPPI